MSCHPGKRVSAYPGPRWLGAISLGLGSPLRYGRDDNRILHANRTRSPGLDPGPPAGLPVLVARGPGSSPGLRKLLRLIPSQLSLILSEVEGRGGLPGLLVILTPSPTPAQAGVHGRSTASETVESSPWVPACAGTGEPLGSPTPDPSTSLRMRAWGEDPRCRPEMGIRLVRLPRPSAFDFEHRHIPIAPLLTRGPDSVALRDHD